MSAISPVGAGVSPYLLSSKIGVLRKLAHRISAVVTCLFLGLLALWTLSKCLREDKTQKIQAVVDRHYGPQQLKVTPGKQGEFVVNKL